MPATKLLVVVGVAASVFCSAALAGSLNESPGTGGTNTADVAAESRHEEGPGLLPVDRAYLRVGTNRFAFLIPAGVKLEPWGSSKVALVARDYGFQITVGTTTFAAPQGSELNPETCSAWVLQEQPQARILSVRSASADSRAGLSYELGLMGPSGVVLRGEIAFVPCRAGVMEFSLVCSPERFQAARTKLSTVMLTFRGSDEHGQLHVSPISDKL